MVDRFDSIYTTQSQRKNKDNIIGHFKGLGFNAGDVDRINRQGFKNKSPAKSTIESWFNGTRKPLPKNLLLLDSILKEMVTHIESGGFRMAVYYDEYKKNIDESKAYLIRRKEMNLKNTESLCS